MRYGFFSAQYLPTVGGVERYTYNLARRVVQAGHQAVVVTSALPGLPDHEIDGEGIEIFRLPSLRLMGGRFPVVKKGGAFARLAGQLWAVPFDFCLINTYFYPLSLYAARQTRRRGIPAIVVNHGSAWLMTGSAPLVLAGQLYERLAAALVKRNVARFYGVSGAACRWLARFGIQTDRVLTNAVDPAQVAQAAAQGEADWRGRLGLPPDTPLIAFAGRLLPEKGVLTLRDALPLIRRAVPGAAMVLAGDGPLRGQLSAENTPGLYLPGAQSYPDTMALLAQAQVFCLPTRSEGFACTVLEAAALGCPIITTATGGSPQLLLDESYGKLLPDRSAQACAQACIQALSSPAWRKTAAEKTARRLNENYTWDKAVQALAQAAKER